MLGPAVLPVAHRPERHKPCDAARYGTTVCRNPLQVGGWTRNNLCIFVLLPLPLPFTFCALVCTPECPNCPHSRPPSNPQTHMFVPSPPLQMWRTIRTLGGAFILVTCLGTLLDDKGLTKSFLNNPDLKPQMSSSTRFADVKGVDEAKVGRRSSWVPRGIEQHNKSYAGSWNGKRREQRQGRGRGKGEENIF